MTSDLFYFLTVFYSGQNISQSVRVYITRLLTWFVSSHFFLFLKASFYCLPLTAYILIIPIPATIPFVLDSILIYDSRESLFSCAKLRSKDIAQ